MWDAAVADRPVLGYGTLGIMGAGRAAGSRSVRSVASSLWIAVDCCIVSAGIENKRKTILCQSQWPEAAETPFVFG